MAFGEHSQDSYFFEKWKEIDDDVEVMLGIDGKIVKIKK